MNTHRARKRFGQHFLHDPRVVERIVAALNPQPGENLIEIGPGLGVLTGPVLERAGRLHVVELDRDLAARLEREPPGAGELIIHNADALDTDFSEFADRGPLRIFGNLPYNISTPLLFHVLDHARIVADMLFMLQKEVVVRMCASPGSKRYGRLTVMLEALCGVEHLFDVGRGAFQPPPKVESAIVRLTPLSAPRIPPELRATHASIVTAAFGQRRKKLRNALRAHLDEETIRGAGVDPDARAEQVDGAGFAALAQAKAYNTGEPVSD